MPEGPSIVILKEESTRFVGQVIKRASGNAKIDHQRLVGQRIKSIRSWGKQFLIELDGFSIRVHFLLFGSYRIDERREMAPRLALQFDRGEMSFYACSVRLLEAPLDELYDWRTDVMSDDWSPSRARAKLKSMPNVYVCDALLDQEVFSGVGNIIKNEVLFRIRVHPLSTIGSLTGTKLKELIKQARQYSFEFLDWKRAFVLRKHWLAHTKSICPRCHIPFSKGKLGARQRRSFYCERCQKLYATAGKRKTVAAPSIAGRRRTKITASRRSTSKRPTATEARSPS